MYTHTYKFKYRLIDLSTHPFLTTKTTTTTTTTTTCMTGNNGCGKYAM
jgi:hypothetical protein